MLKPYLKDIPVTSMPPRREMRKTGTLDIGMVETTPIVWQESLLRMEYVRDEYRNNLLGQCYTRFVGHFDGQTVGKPCAVGYTFTSAYTENGVMYVYGVKLAEDADTSVRHNGADIGVFYSKDLDNWAFHEVKKMPKTWGFYNNSVCKGADGYVMALEAGEPPELVGSRFTILFLTSKNLLDWEFMPLGEHVYSRDYYTACPALRYYCGKYYMIYLESLPHDRWMPYIVRTEDFIEFELGMRNPIMFSDGRDKIIAYPERFTAKEIEYITNTVDVNNSDIDLCEYNGKTYITYSWGTQLGREMLAGAEYDGGEEEFLKSFFAD